MSRHHVVDISTSSIQLGDSAGLAQLPNMAVKTLLSNEMQDKTQNGMFKI